MKFFSDPALRFALRVYLVLRVVLSGIAALARAVYPGDLWPDPVLRPYLGVPPVEGGWRGLLLGVWQRWDTLWYMLIAREGYSLRDTRIFAPPLYPGLMRLAGELLGGGEAAYLMGGIVVSNLACIALFVYFYRLVEMERNVVLARWGVVYLAIFPSAFFLLAAYAESLLMLCTVAAFYHARRKEWLAAGIWGSLAPLARLPGVVILGPLAWEFVRQWWVSRGALSCRAGFRSAEPSSRAQAEGRSRRSHTRRRTGQPLAWWRGWPLTLVVLGGLAYPLYVYLHLGSDNLMAPFTVHTQRFMGRFAMPWESLWVAVRVLASGSFRVIEPFDFAFTLLFIGLTIVALIKLPAIYGLYMAVTLAGILTKVADVQPLLAVTRYALTLFPAFILLAKWGRRSVWWNRVIVYVSVALLLFLTSQFAIWGWVG
jgi:hypothetical protein